MPVDLRSADQIRRLFSGVDKRLGRLDVLVNNAAITAGAQLSEISEELLEDVFAVNVRGLVLATQEAAKRLPPGKACVVRV
jgi:3-oxoacyl-[acyl-carrier protein] reductase